jgi:hypothetical protein
MVMSRTGIENSIPIELLQLPEPSLNKKNIADIIVTNVKIFGGWGKDFWGMDPSKSSGLMKKIMEDPEYSSAVATVSGKLEKKPVGEGTARSGPAKNAPIPKASQMKLGPNGEYGNLIIDVQALYNDGRIIARKRGDEYGSNLHAGKIILDETTSPGLKNLVTKRAMQTTIDKAGAATRAQLVRLRKLAGFNVEKGSGAAKKASPRPSSKSSGIIVVGSPAEIIERMKVACGVFDAGNRSKKNSQLISELASKLMESGVIDKNEYSSILRKYRVGTK